jgi:hypothetical protein
MTALAPRGDVIIEMMASKDGEIALGAVSGVGGELLSQPPGVLFGLLQCVGPLLHVSGFIAQALRNDYLGSGVQCRLRVAGLHTPLPDLRMMRLRGR